VVQGVSVNPCVISNLESCNAGGKGRGENNDCQGQYHHNCHANGGDSSRRADGGGRFSCALCATGRDNSLLSARGSNQRLTQIGGGHKHAFATILRWAQISVCQASLGRGHSEDSVGADLRALPAYAPMSRTTVSNAFSVGSLPSAPGRNQCDGQIGVFDKLALWTNQRLVGVLQGGAF